MDTGLKYTLTPVVKSFPKTDTPNGLHKYVTRHHKHWACQGEAQLPSYAPVLHALNGEWGGEATLWGAPCFSYHAETVLGGCLQGSAEWEWVAEWPSQGELKSTMEGIQLNLDCFTGKCPKSICSSPTPFVAVPGCSLGVLLVSDPTWASLAFEALWEAQYSANVSCYFFGTGSDTAVNPAWLANNVKQILGGWAGRWSSWHKGRGWGRG